MAESDPSAEVHRHLLDIYIQEKDWEKAIGAARKLEASAKRNYQKEIANYHCELAITEQIHGRHAAAHELLDRALEANRKCVRANLLRGEWLAREGRHEDAHRGVEGDRVAGRGLPRPRRRGHGGELQGAGPPGRGPHAAARPAEPLSRASTS